MGRPAYVPLWWAGQIIGNTHPSLYTAPNVVWAAAWWLQSFQGVTRLAALISFTACYHTCRPAGLQGCSE